MQSLKELCLVKCFETVSKGLFKLNLRKLPKTLRHELMEQLVASVPPVMDHFRVVNLIPLDFAWRECLQMLPSYRFTYGLFYSAPVFKRMLINYGLTLDHPNYANFDKTFKEYLAKDLVDRLRYRIEFFRRYSDELKFNGRRLVFREDAGPSPHAVDEIMPFYQTGPPERWVGAFQKGLYPIRLEGNLYITHIVLRVIDYGVRDLSDTCSTIELRPDPEITRGVDALILDKLTKPSIHPVW